MDKVKAIKVLKPLVDSYVDYANISMKEEDDDIVDALEMAVEALEALDVPDTNVGDMISRQMVIDAMKDMYRAAEKWLRDATDDVTKARAESCMASLVEIKLRTEKLPVVQPETATVTIGRTKGSVTMWYECDACGEPIEQKDCYCRNCGRRLKYE